MLTGWLNPLNIDFTREKPRVRREIHTTETGRKGQLVTLNGKTYKSLTQASIAFGCHRDTIKRMLELEQNK